MNPRKTDSSEVFDMDKFRRGMKINMSPSTVGIAILVLLLLVLFIFGGPIYIVGPDEEGVIQTFGKYTSSNQPGLHFKFPWPIQAVKLPKVTEVKRIELGFETVSQGPPAVYRDADNDPRMLKEAQMLTAAAIYAKAYSSHEEFYKFLHSLEAIEKSAGQNDQLIMSTTGGVYQYLK